jgi:hypothetical protein
VVPGFHGPFTAPVHAKVAKRCNAVARCDLGSRWLKATLKSASRPAAIRPRIPTLAIASFGANDGEVQ